MVAVADGVVMYDDPDQPARDHAAFVTRHAFFLATMPSFVKGIRGDLLEMILTDRRFIRAVDRMVDSDAYQAHLNLVEVVEMITKEIDESEAWGNRHRY